MEQNAFHATDKVEIVISDNCSTDNTPEIAKKFVALFPVKIRYVRTENPINSAHNFANALQYAHGELCKLHNDTLMMLPGGLDSCLKRALNEYVRLRPVVFFLNGNSKAIGRERLCNTTEEFVTNASFYMTWIGAFSVWREDVPRVCALFLQESHHFAQVTGLLQSLKGGRSVLVDNAIFGKGQDAPKAVDIEFLNTIFVTEYLTILTKEREAQRLGQKAYTRELKRFFFFFYIPYYNRLAGEFGNAYWVDFRHILKFTNRFLFAQILVAYPLYVLLQPSLKCSRLKKIVEMLRAFLGK